VPGAGGEGSVGVETGADHPADFAMPGGALANEIRPRAKEEIALQLFPGEMKFVAARPCRRTGGRQGIFLPGGVAGGGAGEFGGTDIGVSGQIRPVDLIEETKAWPGKISEQTW